MRALQLRQGYFRFGRFGAERLTDMVCNLQREVPPPPLMGHLSVYVQSCCIVQALCLHPVSGLRWPFSILAIRRCYIDHGATLISVLVGQLASSYLWLHLLFSQAHFLPIFPLLCLCLEIFPCLSSSLHSGHLQKDLR